MTTQQTKKYFWEWGQVRSYLVAKGIDPKQADVKRHELHKKALGRMKSSKEFTNSDLDKVIAVFRAVWDDANFDAQMRQQGQPELRRQSLLDACMAAVGEMYAAGDTRLEHEKTRLAYIEGTARNVLGKETSACGEAELGRLKGILQRHAKRLIRAEEQRMQAESVPF